LIAKQDHTGKPGKQNLFDEFTHFDPLILRFRARNNELSMRPPRRPECRLGLGEAIGHGG
jgi:hypothetical protein